MIAFSTNGGMLFAWLKGKRLNDSFHITVYSTHHKLKYIKLESYQMDITSSKKLYPVFYFDNGKIFIADALNIKNMTLYGDKSSESYCVDAICNILKIEPYMLKYAADNKNVYITIDDNATRPIEYPSEANRCNARVISDWYLK